jgi:hypothetical protein
VLGFGHNLHSANPEAAIYTVHTLDVQRQPQYAELKHEADMGSFHMRHTFFLRLDFHWPAPTSVRAGSSIACLLAKAVTGEYVKLNFAASFAIV